MKQHTIIVAALAVLLPLLVGAGHGAADCDLTVRDGDSIQTTLMLASTGDTVCVRPGTYEEDVEVKKDDVVLRGLTPARSGNPATVEGSVSLEAHGTVVHRLAVTRTDDIAAPEPIDAFGIRVTASDTVVADNLVHSLTGESKNWGAINGIQVFGSSAISDIVVRDNTVTDLHNELDDDAVGGVAGVKLQADLDGVSVTGNDVTDLHSAGWAWGVVLQTSGSHSGVPKDVVVEGNTMDRLNDGSEYDVFAGPNDGRDAAPYPGSAFGVDAGADAAEVTSFTRNNLLAPNGAESKDEDATLAAECNWWGDRSGPTNDDNPDGEGTWALERGSADIAFEPWLNSPAPSQACVGRS